MSIFLPLTFFLFFLGAWQISRQGRSALSRQTFAVVSFLSLFILSGFRAITIGTDTPMYTHTFYLIRGGLKNLDLLKGRFEIGFRLYECLIGEFTENSHVFLIITSLITILLIFRLFYKESKLPWFSVLLYICLMFYYDGMSLIRQHLAIAFTCTAYTFLAERYKKTGIETKYNLLFVIFTILAGLFHSSAYLFLIFLPLSYIRLDKNKRWKYIILAIVTALCINKLLSYVVRLFPRYANYLLSDRYYLQNKFGSIIKTLIYLLFFLLIEYIYSVYRDGSYKEHLEYWSVLLSFVLTLSSIRGWILTRMAMYFGILLCVAIPNYLSNIENRTTKYILAACIIAGGLAYNLVLFIFRPYWSGVLPYIFWE